MTINKRMRDYFKTKTWIITALMFVVAFSLSLMIAYFELGSRQNVKVSSASSSNNVTGWAWSSNIGWVSFNCTNDNPACGSSNYGVSIDLATGHFSGYAWSPNVGWISFNETGAPNYDFKANCQTANSCTATGNCTACFNWGDSKVYGWGKILSMGDNGWMKFNDTWLNGVIINQAGGATNGQLSGWAWNANNDDKSGIGWLSFNCSNDSPACGSSNYNVHADVNRPPTATVLNAPNWSFSDARNNNNALRAKLGWSFSDQDSGQHEYAYQIIVNTSNSITNPAFDSGQCFGYNNPTNKCKIDVSDTSQFFINSADLSSPFQYNTPYYWWVKVWDDNVIHKDSGYVQFDTNVSGHELTHNQAGNTARNLVDPNLTFTTYKHEMPIANYSHFPDKPSKGEEVKFTNTSQVYLSSAPNTAVNCTSAECTYLWVAPGATFKDNDTATTSPIIIFNSAGKSRVTLTVTDNDGYSISYYDDINVNAKLPKWKEVKPE